MANKKKLAIIGAGISGLSVAFHLHKHYDITIFEKEDYLGGHTDTHELLIDSQAVRVDSGFIIFCPDYYPHFCAMLAELGVESQPTDMSFSAHNRKTGLIYNATSFSKLFCQRRNLLRPRFYRMLFDIVRFYNTSSKVLESDDTQTTVADYLAQNNYGDGFTHDHLLPMISALWSATPERVALFPIRHLVEFFQNHGLMKIINRPQWRVVKNGSASYVNALREQLNVTWRPATAVRRVERRNDVTVTTASDEQHQFDAVVFATHADQALALLDAPSDDEQAVLAAIPFEKNHVVVHTDDSIMHANKKSWASWNTEVPNDFDVNGQRVCTANYWMNSLQSLELKSNVFTSLNSQYKINPDKILAQRTYYHPVFTAESVAAQQHKPRLDGQHASYYVGAYWGWGFHEDGARSAANVSVLIREQIR